MPILVSCQCGKKLNVKDQFAGKAIKCPGCATTLKVPAAGAAPAAPAAPTQAPSPAPAAPAGPGNVLSDLFDEEGFGTQVASACPSCASELAAGTVLCTKCGFHLQEGMKIEGHRTAGLDIDYGEVASMRAEDSLARDVKLQKEMQSRAGLPWWGLALVLFVVGSGLALAVVAVNDANRVDGAGSFDALKTFYVMCAVACGVVAGGALVKLIFHSVKQNATKAQKIKTGILMVVMIGAAIGLVVAAINR